MIRHRWPACSAVARIAVVLVCLAAPGVKGPVNENFRLLPVRPDRMPVAAGSQRHDVTGADTGTAPAALAAQDAGTAAPDGYYDRLRARLRWVQTRIGPVHLLTPDLHSRVLLAKSAAQRAGLQEVGLSFLDVYGIINAETSWVPRHGASKDGTPNLGIAQFEPATAKALGLRNPDDAVEAVHVAAVHMKQAALWSAERLEGLKLDAGERATKLREGVSIYYNLSSRGRAAWNGRNTRKLPRETQLHIRNARAGALEAAFLEAELQAAKFEPQEAEAILTAGVASGS